MAMLINPSRRAAPNKKMKLSLFVSCFLVSSTTLVVSSDPGHHPLLRRKHRKEARNLNSNNHANPVMFRGTVARSDCPAQGQQLQHSAGTYVAEFYGSDADRRTLCVRYDATVVNPSGQPEIPLAYITVLGGARLDLVYGLPHCNGDPGRRLSAGMSRQLMNEEVYLVLDSQLCNGGNGHQLGELAGRLEKIPEPAKPMIFAGAVTRSNCPAQGQQLQHTAGSYEAKFYSSDSTLCVGYKATVVNPLGQPEIPIPFVTPWWGPRLELVYGIPQCNGDPGIKLPDDVARQLMNEELYLVLDSQSCNGSNGHYLGEYAGRIEIRPDH